MTEYKKRAPEYNEDKTVNRQIECLLSVMHDF